LPRYVIDGIAGYARWTKVRVYEEWEGEYLEFDHYHLRAWRHDGVLWLLAKDIATAMGLENFNQESLARRLPADCIDRFGRGKDLVLNDDGLRAWLDPMESKRTTALRLWLERNVLLQEANRRRLRGEAISAEVLRNTRADQ
jgi:hypothetical protein